MVLSAAYLASRFASAEWAAAFASDPTGERRALVPVAVEPITAPGLWSAIVRVDLVGLSEDEAKRLLLDAVDRRPVATPAGQATGARFPPDARGVAPGASTPVVPPRAAGGPSAVDVWRLPVAPGPLIGRDDELDRWQARVRLGSLTERVREVGYGRLARRLNLLRISLSTAMRPARAGSPLPPCRALAETRTRPSGPTRLAFVELVPRSMPSVAGRMTGVRVRRGLDEEGVRRRRAGRCERRCSP